MQGHGCSAAPGCGQSQHTLWLESLPLGFCSHLPCWEKVFSFSSPLLALLSPRLGWRVGSSSASSAKFLPRRRHAQQTKWKIEVLFPRGALERSLQQDLGARRLTTTCPSPKLTAAFVPWFLLPTSSSQGGAGKPLPCGWLSILLPLAGDLPPWVPRWRGSLLLSVVSVAARTWGGCWSSPADQACHAAHSACACCCHWVHRPQALHLVPLRRQLPDLLEGTETQQQAGLFSAPGGASFGSNPCSCPLPLSVCDPNRYGALKLCQAPQLMAKRVEQPKTCTINDLERTCISSIAPGQNTVFHDKPGGNNRREGCAALAAAFCSGVIGRRRYRLCCGSNTETPTWLLNKNFRSFFELKHHLNQSLSE